MVRHGRDDPLNGGRLARLPLRAIQVHHVDPSGAGIHEPASHRDRIAAVAGLARVVALEQADDPTRPQVDRRDDLESHGLTTLLVPC